MKSYSEVIDISDFPDNKMTGDIQENENITSQQTTYKKMLEFFGCNKENREKILIPSAIEAIATYSPAAVVSPFISKNTSWYWHPFAMSSFVLACNLLSRIMGRSKRFREDEWLLWSNLGVRSNLYGFFNSIFAGTLLHEFGHAIAFLILYNNTHPFINITLPSGAYTQNINGTPNEWALMLGENKTYAIVSASGAGHEMLWAYGGLLAAQLISDDYPEIKMHIRLSVLYFVLSSATYALSALWSC